ncbi:MAG TPA: LPS assembly protein LptD, partial [Oxalicibacterium sp.]|nr:LPS assembly protein LptD [Oxalicibacterium sp.]
MSLTVAAVALPAVAQTTAERKVSDDEAPTNVSAEQMTGRPDREVVLERDVEITRGETTVNSDHATYWIEEDEVEASGNVRMTRFGDRYTGDKMRLKMDTGEGYVENPTYHMKANNAHGTADRLDFESQERARVSSGTYSTCEGPNPDWYLESSTMTFDKGLDTGTASGAVIYFKDVPIIGTPYISFPLSDARKSGFLPPSIGTSSRGGLEIMTPYYFNIAPNRDFTLSPRYIARRGLMIGGEARYLDYDYSGETKFEYLGDDRETHTNRYSISSQHRQRLTPQALFAWNLNGASDDDYPSDFSQNLATSTERLLLRDLNFTYKGSFWAATARASNYQVLQDPDAPITRPYDRLPQLTWRGQQYDVGGFDWSTTVQATSFWHPDYVRGDRFVVNPSVSYPIVRPSYFITPKVSLTATSYNLQNTAAQFNNGLTYDSSPGYALPTFSLDSGLIFERDTN